MANKRFLSEDGLAYYDGKIKAIIASIKRSIQDLITGKQDVLSAGDNIRINTNVISAKGYRYNDANNAFTTGDYTANTGAKAENAFAEGYRTIASAPRSHAEGNQTEASGNNSHAEGESNTASGYASHAEGEGNTAPNRAQHVSGRFATVDNTGKVIFQVGDGTDASHRHDAIRVDTDIALNSKDGLIGMTAGGGATMTMDDTIDIHGDSVDVNHAVVAEDNKKVFVHGVGGFNGDTNNSDQAQTVQEVMDKLAKLAKAGIVL